LLQYVIEKSHSQTYTLFGYVTDKAIAL